MSKILVADDSYDCADSLAMFLSISGHQTSTAYDGRQAVDAAAVFRPDVVFLDIDMPVLDGYGAARLLRQVAPTAPPVLVALTAVTGPDARQHAKEAGFDFHLTKPANLDQVLEIIDAATAGGSSH